MNAHWTERLSEYLDGDLSPAERETCEAHLDACADCARLLEELKSVVAEAGALPLVPPPAGLWDAIESRLETPVLQFRPRAAAETSCSRAAPCRTKGAADTCGPAVAAADRQSRT